jgi:hypothetical protein
MSARHFAVFYRLMPPLYAAILCLPSSFTTMDALGDSDFEPRAVFPLISRDHFDAIQQRYFPDASTQEVAEEVHSTYLQRARELNTAIADELAPFDREIDDMWAEYYTLRRELAPGGIMSAEVRARLNEVRADIHNRINELHPARAAVVARSVREGLRLFDSFLADIEEQVLNGDAETRESIARFLRRSVMLPRRGPYLDFSAPVNIIQLYEAASAEGGEFHQLAAVAEFEDSVLAILLDYEIAQDRLIVARLHDLRRPHPGPGVSAVSEDQKRQDQWIRIHHVRAGAVDRIAAVAESYGGFDARRAWQERWWNALALRLIAGAELDDMFDRFLDSMGEDEPETSELLRMKHTDFVRRRHDARERAYAAGVDARRWHPYVVSGSHPKQRLYIRRLIELTRLQNEFIDTVAGVLPPQHRAEWQVLTASVSHPTQRVPENVLQSVGVATMESYQ